MVLGYLCIQIYTIFHRTYKTETAIAYTMSDNITLKGVAVFQAVDVPGSGNLGYVVQDGERVSAGTILAEQYTDDSQGAMRERLDRLDRAILLLTKSENSSGSDLSVLTTQTRTALYNLLDQIDTASYGAIQDAAEDFLLAQNKLQISTGQAAGFGEVLASLQAERDGIAAQLNGLQTIEADTNGYFVSSESAAPVVRDPTELDAMSPADLQKMINAGGDSVQCRPCRAYCNRVFLAVLCRVFGRPCRAVERPVPREHQRSGQTGRAFGCHRGGCDHRRRNRPCQSGAGMPQHQCSGALPEL